MNKKKEQHDKGENKNRILLVDDDPVVRQELIGLINQAPDFVVCAEAENVGQALTAVENNQVDLAIVATSMEGTTYGQVVEKIKLQRPKLPVLTIPTSEFLLK
jgi:two-component system NarL family response regulator